MMTNAIDLILSAPGRLVRPAEVNRSLETRRQVSGLTNGGLSSPSNLILKHEAL
jgi:hypothetical protein